jgi:putative transposase
LLPGLDLTPAIGARQDCSPPHRERTMKTKRLMEVQVIGVLNDADAGAKTNAPCRRRGISYAAFFNRKAKYAWMTASQARRLEELGHENARGNVEAWRIEYNTERPRSSLAKQTSQEIVASRGNTNEARVVLTADSCAFAH